MADTKYLRTIISYNGSGTIGFSNGTDILSFPDYSTSHYNGTSTQNPSRLSIYNGSKVLTFGNETKKLLVNGSTIDHSYGQIIFNNGSDTLTLGNKTTRLTLDTGSSSLTLYNNSNNNNMLDIQNNTHRIRINGTGVYYKHDLSLTPSSQGTPSGSTSGQTTSTSGQNEPPLNKNVVSQGFISSSPTKIPGEKGQTATILAPRSDKAVYSGILTYQASKPVKVVVWNNVNPDNKTAIPKEFGSQGDMVKLGNGTVALTTLGSSGKSGSVPFTGNAIELVNSGGGKNKGFTATYSVNVVGTPSKMVNNLESIAAAVAAANSTGSSGGGSGGIVDGGDYVQIIKASFGIP